jgi:hypothetical protein
MCLSIVSIITSHGNKIIYCNSYLPFTFIKCPKYGCIINIEYFKDHIADMNKHEGLLG